MRTGDAHVRVKQGQGARDSDGDELGLVLSIDTDAVERAVCERGRKWVWMGERGWGSMWGGRIPG